MNKALRAIMGNYMSGFIEGGNNILSVWLQTRPLSAVQETILGRWEMLHLSSTYNMPVLSESQTYFIPGFDGELLGAGYCNIISFHPQIQALIFREDTETLRDDKNA